MYSMGSDFPTGVHSDQRLCCSLPSIPLVSIHKISSLYLPSVAAQASLSLPWSLVGFLMTWLYVMRKPEYGICEQQRRRSTCACTSVQSDQHLCCLLPRYHTSTCYIWNFKTLASFWSWAGWFVLPGWKSQRQVFSWHGSYITKWCQQSKLRV